MWGGRAGNTSKQQKMAASSEQFLSEKDSEALFCFSHFLLEATLLRKLRRSLQVKGITTNAPCVL